MNDNWKETFKCVPAVLSGILHAMTICEIKTKQPRFEMDTCRIRIFTLGDIRSVK